MAEAVHLITTLTGPEDLSVDLFAGSGTVPIAALQTGRPCIAADNDLQHVESERYHFGIIGGWR